uniref:Transposase n=1 Tax=Melanopsichium pennsylvanicum 4 TaxID=1398559 RepID=A0A077R7U0_9BASI|nr:hypothetical protein BN887_05670 [Melanopsichium pennsylvanicum 4]
MPRTTALKTLSLEVREKILKAINEHDLPTTEGPRRLIIPDATVLKAEPADYNQPGMIRTRREWAQNYIDSGAVSSMLYIDESGSNLHQHVTYGRAKRGGRAIRVVPSVKGGHISYIAAIAAKGFITNFAGQAPTTETLFI